MANHTTGNRQDVVHGGQVDVSEYVEAVQIDTR